VIQITPQMRILVAIEAVDGRKGKSDLEGCLVAVSRGTSTSTTEPGQDSLASVKYPPAPLGRKHAQLAEMRFSGAGDQKFSGSGRA